MMFLIIKWDEVFQGFLINVISGLIVSFIFLFVLLKLFRPKILISNFICKKDEKHEDSYKPKYTFKLVNKSIYHAFDAKVELFLMQPNQHLGAQQNLTIKQIKTRTSNMNHIKRFTKKLSNKDPFALFAILIHTNENLEEMLQQCNSYIELKVTVRHGLTALADTFIQQFGDTDVIRINHKFEFGQKLNTISINKTI